MLAGEGVPWAGEVHVACVMSGEGGSVSVDMALVLTRKRMTADTWF